MTNPLLKLHKFVKGILQKNYLYFYYEDLNSENENLLNENFIYVISVMHMIVKYYGKERLRNFIKKPITKLNLFDWEENVLIIIFCVHNNIWKDEYLATLEAVITTSMYPSILQTHHYDNEVKNLEPYFIETPLKFNIMRYYLLREIKKVEEEELQEMIRKQKELQYDYLINYGDNY